MEGQGPTCQKSHPVSQAQTPGVDCDISPFLPPSLPSIHPPPLPTQTQATLPVSLMLPFLSIQILLSPFHLAPGLLRVSQALLAPPRSSPHNHYYRFKHMYESHYFPAELWMVLCYFLNEARFLHWHSRSGPLPLQANGKTCIIPNGPELRPHCMPLLSLCWLLPSDVRAGLPLFPLNTFVLFKFF